ncbi:MAG: hypothetical protein LBG64_04395 [Pseudomonadales bacterium]|jgi:hypothetical protein|nr:hypothetical protein [Pseudomonadales bacterium]
MKMFQKDNKRLQSRRATKSSKNTDLYIVVSKKAFAPLAKTIAHLNELDVERKARAIELYQKYRTC